MNDNIYWMLELAIRGDSQEPLKALLDEMVAATQADEPGTLNYEWFISADGKQCHIYERYADSAALMTHLGNFGSKFAKRFMSLLQPTRFVVYGNTDDQVKSGLAGLGPVYMAPLGGFTR
jgi:quinol monooxygenase YgiN